jgi:hypothetical protein
MAHRHDHCEHDLKYCEKCDVVYCLKCDKEWGGHYCHSWYPYYIYTPTTTIPYTTPTVPYTTCGSSDFYQESTVPHEHVCHTS